MKGKMSKATRLKLSQSATATNRRVTRQVKAPIDRHDNIEETASELDRLAYELWIAGARLSSVNNQLWHFLSDPRRKADRQLYRRIAKRALQWPNEPTCLKCGCTEFHACEGGCSWSFLCKENNWGICSTCLHALGG